jgi:hypothetical protein
MNILFVEVVWNLPGVEWLDDIQEWLAGDLEGSCSDLIWGSHSQFAMKDRRKPRETSEYPIFQPKAIGA